ncbi:MAG: STT3 domain-containing protein [Anaerolineales bacterium]
MRKAEWIALLISLAGVVAAYLVAIRVYEAVPHVEDEMAYVWQAKVLAHGQMTAPTPPEPQSMYVPFVVDANGHRSAKYPPGWPMVLALGILLGIRTWVNPLLGGLMVWLTFRLGQKICNSATGLLAALLTVTSPFFLMISGSLDSNSWSLILSIIFILAWLDTFLLGARQDPTSKKFIPSWLTISVAGLSLGLLVITRPLTALGVSLPFFLHGMVLLWRGNGGGRRHVLAIGAIALLVGSLFLVWQYAVTGNPFTDPYTLWWSFDRIGFGPGIGLEPGGHTLQLGIHNARLMLTDLNKDLFGWAGYSWIFLPFGVWALRKNRAAWLSMAVFVCLVICYVFYWASVTRYGPRYYYEGLYGLTLASAAGILWLAGSLKAQGWYKLRIFLVGAILAGLVSYNLAAFLPARFGQIYGLYDVHHAQLSPFLTAQARAKTPALVIVHTQKIWTEYAGLLELEDPWLTSPFIFAWSNNGSISDAGLAALYPNRQIIYYYPDEPDKFYSAPR